MKASSNTPGTPNHPRPGGGRPRPHNTIIHPSPAQPWAWNGQPRDDCGSNNHLRTIL